MNIKQKLCVARATVATLAMTMILVGCGGSGSSSSTSTTKVPQNFTAIDGPGSAPTTINGISNSGVIVGFTTTGTTNSNFVRSATGTFTTVNLGDPAGMLNAINSKGVGVGVANGKAFSLSGTTVTPITPTGTTSSAALGINDAGTIVGQGAMSTTLTPGFADIKGTFTTIMPTAASTVVNAQGVNSAGLVVGFYTENGTNQHGFYYNLNA